MALYEEFKTTDIVLAAALRYAGYSLKLISKNGNIGTFVFDGVPKDVVEDFDCGKILVEPVAFNQNIKTLTTATRR